MKLLNGKELASYIQQRQQQQIRALLGAGITPKLAIVQVKDDPVIDTYVRLKKRYGVEVGIEVESHHPDQKDIQSVIEALNDDPTVHGVIVQLPLADPSETDRVVDLVASSKDVDALGASPDFEPATPMAIMWLLAGFNVNLAGKRVLLIGRGKLVGQPLERLLTASGIDVHVADRSTKDLAKETLESDVIITPTGSTQTP